MIESLRETTEATMIEAHKAGVTFWRYNRTHDAKREALSELARTCGWHGEDNVAWLAGYYGEQKRSP